VEPYLTRLDILEDLLALKEPMACDSILNSALKTAPIAFERVHTFWLSHSTPESFAMAPKLVPVEVIRMLFKCIVSFNIRPLMVPKIVF
jgi:hypothetical protein